MFDHMIDARGQQSADLADLPFDGIGGDLAAADTVLRAPYRLPLLHDCASRVSCLAMPQLLARNPFAQGLANCAALARVTVEDMLSDIEAVCADQKEVETAVPLEGRSLRGEVPVFLGP